MRLKTIVPALAATALCTLATGNLWAQGTAKKESGKMEMMSGPSAITKAKAVLHATKIGGEASGVITFTKVDGGIHVEGEIRGLAPGSHGFHVHEYGDVSSPDAMSAGGHFNPEKADHAGPSAPKRHVGDLGNIEANAKGVAKIDVTDPHLSFSGRDSIIGRGLIVHEKADDLKSQPAGNAGGRVAAGVIGVAKGS